jgi:hypothetical protein
MAFVAAKVGRIYAPRDDRSAEFVFLEDYVERRERELPAEPIRFVASVMGWLP